jgi:hypothetical protein
VALKVQQPLQIAGVQEPPVSGDLEDGRLGARAGGQQVGQAGRGAAREEGFEAGDVVFEARRELGGEELAAGRGLRGVLREGA